jgi:prepilin peptidase CpaA
MNLITWCATLTLVTVAAIIDIRCRRIPNWLVVPFLAAGMAFGLEQHGLVGIGKSLGGIVLAVVALGGLCRLRAIGMGDLKLCAAVGSWIGFAQLGVALVVMAVAGGAIGILWTAQFGAAAEALDGASELLFSLPHRGFRPHPTLSLDNPRAHKMPYAPAIAIGTIFSFFC